MIRAAAPAKINLTLEVLRRRDDGYHEIRSVMQTIDLRDELTFEQGDAVTLTVEGPHTASGDDLVIRAARLLQSASGQDRGAAIHLRKRIPLGAGLGGGSADAAAALTALSGLWGLRLDDERLMTLAAEIGSDVAFFLHGGTALAEGRGERVTPLADLPATWIVLLVPPLSMPDKTRRMYGSLTEGDFTDGSRTERLLRLVGSAGPVTGTDIYNAFDRPAYEVFQGLDEHRQRLLEAGAPMVHLAGAGSALFALAAGEREARALAARLVSPAAAVFAVRTLAAGEAALIERAPGS